jgi:acyl-CoA thioester hydrolase/thioesterase-3
MNFSHFESEMQVRPDDIDMNQHVHNSRYFDYVLAARYDQMERFYKFPMEEFLAQDFGWVVSKATIEYKRPLGLGDRFKVTTGIKSMEPKGCVVDFQIVNSKTGKLCCDGAFHYTMINTKTGRSEVIPEWIVERYSI